MVGGGRRTRKGKSEGEVRKEMSPRRKSLTAYRPYTTYVGSSKKRCMERSAMACERHAKWRMASAVRPTEVTHECATLLAREDKRRPPLWRTGRMVWRGGYPRVHYPFQFSFAAFAVFARLQDPVL